MVDERVYSVSAIFNTPDQITHAAELTVEKGYAKFDVHSPYPLHGMNTSMGLKPSKLGYITLIFGLSGAAFALLFMYWVSVFEYPLVIGGKPLFQLPAFIPVTFEVTVLLAAISTVVGMLFIFFKFPNNSHPLHDTEYMKHVSSDKFGLTIQTIDPLFNEEKVRLFMQELGAAHIYSISYDESELNTKSAVFDKRFLLLQALIVISVASITYFVLNHLLFMPPFDWMAHQAKINPQSKSTVFADGVGMRLPVDGTVSRGHLPYPFKGEPDRAAKFLRNPLLPTEKVIGTGKEQYKTFCSPCHGSFGKGDSRLRGQFPNPPTLHSEKVRNWPDGMIFNIITEGQNIMPPHASQIDENNRWSIVHYLRTLQRAVNAKESDLP